MINKKEDTLDIADKILFELKIKEHFEGGNKKYVLTKEQLIDFVRNYNKLLFKIEEEMQ